MPFYIGKGLLRRAKELRHGRNKYHQNIVAKYGVENIIIKIIDRDLTEEQAHSRECDLIRAFRAVGYQLANLTDGGEGLAGFKHSLESIAKMSTALKGNKHCLGRVPSPEHRAKISALSKGKHLSPDHRAQISARRKGKATTLGFKHTPESIAKMRASHLGCKISAETRAKLRLRKYSAESRTKLSVALKSHWDKKKNQMENLSGKHFTDWQVLEYLGRDQNNHSRWLCRCVCGNMRNVIEGNLLRGLTKSCGCKRRFTAAENLRQLWRTETFATATKAALRQSWTSERRAQLAQRNRLKARRRDDFTLNLPF